MTIDHAGGHQHEPHVDCAVCGHDYPFTLPPALLEAVEDGRLVVFAGAGVSTETPLVFPHSFYEEILAQLSEPPAEESFPAIMSAFQEEFGRLKLIEEAMTRLRYAETFPAVRYMATRFHTELATIAYIREIITTNWDSFFEEECGALPIVVDGDYAFYNLPGRKVYKIHGSIRNVSTVVATAEDYEQTAEQLRTSAIGGTLRHLLATKTVVFVGYSLRDSDFRNVYGPLLESMGQLRPVAYFVSPFESAEAEDLGLRHLKTDGTHFLRSVKAHLVEKDALIADSGYDRIENLREVVRECHELTVGMNWRENPLLVFSIAYQDGLLDALNRMLSQWKTGEYSGPNHVAHTAVSYDRLLHIAVERCRFWDAAYIDGYANGLIVLGAGEGAERAVPMYELFDGEAFAPAQAATDADSQEDREAVAEAPQDGSREDEQQAESDASEDDGPHCPSEEEVLSHLEGLASALPAVLEEGSRIVGGLPEGIVPQHTPFLYGVMDAVQARRL